MKRLLLVVMTLGLFAATHPVHAETPTVDLLGPVSIIRSDDIVPVDVVVSSAGKVINAADVTVAYPTGMLAVDRIQREQTVFELWPEEPSVDTTHGTIHLVGGHPNGLVMINARIATIYFRVIQPGTANLSVDGDRSGLYLNDGAGTKVSVDTQASALTIHDSLYPGIPLASSTHATPETWSTTAQVEVSWPADSAFQYSYAFSQDARVTPDDLPETVVGEVRYNQLNDGRYYFTIKQRPVGGAWSEITQRRFLIDSTPPSPFQIVHPNPAAVGGHSIISWAAQDESSGIEQSTLTINGRQPSTVSSPLTLQPSWQGKTLTITVTDQAGNQRSATYRYADVTNRHATWWSIGGLTLIALVVVVSLIFILRRR